MVRLQLHLSDGPGRCDILRLEGELDLSTEITLGKACADLLERRHSKIVIDASGLEFCDCSGLSTLIHAQREAERQGGYLRLIGVHGQLARLLTVAGLVDSFPPYEDLRQACG
ncbi:STAS domain-containing protein [Nonomuraea sp. B12E4]|uniref:STAS domain-containing protein n=1 Tax=Nonomuraea sp. B12E4 TaxID=3153564 RepID=UPI00325E84D5